MLRKISKYMSKERLQFFSQGLFYSKLSYCLPVFGNTFGLDSYKEENSRYTSFTMKDNNALQVLQNSLNRLITGAEYNTPTAELLQETDTLSIHQLITYQTAVMSYKIIQSKKPAYIAERMQVRTKKMRLRGNLGGVEQHGRTLAIAKEGFICRGASILNKLEENLRCEPKLEKFKSGVKIWIKANIPIKPTSKFSDLGSRTWYHPPDPDPDPDPDPEESVNDIRRYFQPLARATTN